MTPAIRSESHLDSKLDIVFLFANGLLLAVVAAGAFVPNLRLWGVDHLSYYPSWVRLAAILAAALPLLPGVGEWISIRLISALEYVTASPVRRRIFTGVAVLSALILFLALHASTELLGDGQLQSKLLVRMTGSSDVDLAYFARTVLDDSTAPLTNLLVYAVAKLSGSGNPVSVWRHLNALVGGVFVLAAIGIVFRSRARTGFRLLLLAVLFVSGGVQHFFGYIETYAPMIVLVILYVAAAYRDLHERNHVLIPVSLFILAVVFHYQALLLAPSVIFILLTRAGAATNTRSQWIITAVIATTTITAAAAASRLAGSSEFFLSLFPGENTPAIFDPAHLADIANELLLILPIAPLLLAITVAGRFIGRRPTTDSEAHDPKESGDTTGDRGFAFAITIHVPCVVFLFAFLPELGMARDWDLFSFPAIGAALPLIVFARRALESPVIRACLTRHLAPAVAAGLAIVVPWVGINADETKSVNRYEAVLDFASTDAGYGYEILALHFEDRGDFDGKAAAYDRAYALSNNPRHLVSACSARLRSGEIDRATATLKTYLESNPEYDLAREVYIEALVRTGNMRQVIQVCQDGIQISPERPYYHYCLGIAYREEGFPDKAEKAFDDCRKLEPPTIMLEAIDEMMGSPRR